MKLLTFICLLLLGMSNSVLGQTTFSYQGSIIGPGSEPLSGIHQVTIKLYDAPEGGTLLHAEEFETVVRNGIFQIEVGTITPLLPTVLPQARWLGISIDGSDELTPRTPIKGAPFAHALSPDAPGVVHSINGASGNVEIKAGPGLAITSDGNVLTLNSTVKGRQEPQASIHSVSGTTNQINATTTSGDVTLSTPQDIHSGASPTFSGVRLTSLTPAGVVHNSGNGVLSTAEVSYADIQDVTDNRLLGRSAGSDGSVQEITVGSGLTLSGATLAAASSTFSGPASSTDHAVVRFDGTSGALGQNSALIVEDYSTTIQDHVAVRAEDGSTSDIALVLAPKGEGALMADIPDGTTTGGNARGHLAVDWQRSRIASDQVAAYYGSTIGGGANNKTGALWTVIAGGWYNSASGWASTIGGGLSNDVEGEYSTISGGFSNDANGQIATVAGGSSNSAEGDRTTVGGGSSNNAPGESSSILGGVSNTAYGEYTSIGGGSEHYAGGAYSTIVGGFDNQTDGAYSVAHGKEARTRLTGQAAQASGKFTSAGDAQTAVYIARRVTTGSTSNVLFLDGAAERITIQPSTAMRFHILVVGITADAADVGSYEITGCIRRDGSGNTSLVGAVNQTDVDETAGAAGWNATASADDPNDALVVRVTGADQTTIRWVARIQTAEVSY